MGFRDGPIHVGFGRGIRIFIFVLEADQCFDGGNHHQYYICSYALVTCNSHVVYCNTQGLDNRLLNWLATLHVTPNYTRINPWACHSSHVWPSLPTLHAFSSHLCGLSLRWCAVLLPTCVGYLGSQPPRLWYENKKPKRIYMVYRI